jgi:DNA-binding Lrp family transcriptional regulator
LLGVDEAGELAGLWLLPHAPAQPIPHRRPADVLRRRAVITTIVLIKADPKAITQAATRIAGVDGVAEVYSVSGEWDLVAIVRVPEYEQIAHVVTEQIAGVPGITRTLTLTAFRSYSKQDLEQAWDIGVE